MRSARRRHHRMLAQRTPYGIVGVSAPRLGGVFAAVSAGKYQSCGLRVDGTIECWLSANSASGLVLGASPPGDQFTAVSTGERRFRGSSRSFFGSCALRTDGTIECWDWTDQDLTSPPGGEFSEIVSESTMLARSGLTERSAVGGITTRDRPRHRAGNSHPSL